MSSGHIPSRRTDTSAWWLVLCLIGLDYFSSLAYLPSLAVEAAGPLAPLAAIVVVGVTLLGALPVYLYVVGRSPHGRGGTGLIERLVPGWRGKLLVLLILAFVATDYVVTQNLSVADAAEHLRANPYFRAHVDPFVTEHLHVQEWSDSPLMRRIFALFDRQVVVTLLLSAVSFALWAWWSAGGTRVFLRTAVLVVAGYLLLNLIVVGSGAAWLAGEGSPLTQEWIETVRDELRAIEGPAAPTWVGLWRLSSLALVSFPYVALGLSGFELSLAVAPFVRGSDDDDDELPRGRIRNARKLMAAAAMLMAAALLGSVSVVAIVIPPRAFHPGGAAVHRALSYLAHGGMLTDGSSATALNPLFGPAFGTLYDIWTIAILCLAGAFVAIALRDYVPQYLQRFGMEIEWVHRIGVRMRLFNVLVLMIVVLFHANIASLQWVYTMSVLVLLSGGVFAAMADLGARFPAGWWRLVTRLPVALLLAFLLTTVVLTVTISRAGLEIASAFCVGILAISFVSRWIRSMELRFDGFAFVDDHSRRLWEECCAHDFQVIVPHRPGLHPRAEKVRAIHERHRLSAATPIILVEATLDDPSDFRHAPLMRVSRPDGMTLIEVSRCASISHVLAAIGLAMSKVGRPPELHFGWSDESPLAANVNFLLFGEGNVPWMVRTLLQKAEADPEKRPRVIIG